MKKNAIAIILTFTLLNILAIANAQPTSPLPEIDANAFQSDRYPFHNVTFANGVRGI